MRILNERGPKDIINAYKNTRDLAHVDKIDFENSKFKELSKEEAMQLLQNQQGDQFKLLINGEVIALDEKGRVASPRTRYVSSEQDYTGVSGARTAILNRMPGSHLIKIADKIFSADIKRKDLDLMNQRANRESDVVNTYSELSGAPRMSTSRGWYHHAYGPLSDLEYYPYNTLNRTNLANAIHTAYDDDLEEYKNNLEYYQGMIKKIDKKMDKLDVDSEEYARFLQRRNDYAEQAKDAEISIEYITDKISKEINLAKDLKAALRYSDSMKNMIDRKDEIRATWNKSQRLQKQIEAARENIDNVKHNGSQIAIDRRRDLYLASKELDNLKNELNNVTEVLKHTNEIDAQALTSLQAKYKKIEDEFNQSKDLISKLAKIRKE